MLQKYLHIFLNESILKQGSIYVCLDTGVTSDASQPRQCIKTIKVNKARYEVIF